MPSILNGLFAGRSGLTSHGLAISVVGDNLSNASTVGFKAARAEFQDLVSAGQPADRTIGSGAQVGGVVSLQEQGTLEFTSRSLDVAIEGSGYFIIESTTGRSYTRAGNFRVNEDGILVTQEGDKVLGFRNNGTGGLEDLSVSEVFQENVSTSTMEVSGNLDAQPTAQALSATVNGVPLARDVVAGTTTPVATDPSFADLNDEAEFSTVVNIYDSLGQEHSVSLYFFRTSASAPQYTVRAYGQSDDLDPSAAFTGRPRLLTDATGAVQEVQLSFDSDGTLSATSATSLDVSIPWNNGSTEQALSIDLDGFTQFAASSSVSAITQDGQGVGSVTALNIGTNGEIFAVLDTARTTTIGTLALANFFNPEGLRRVGENYLQESNESGEPIVGSPETGRLGSVQSGSLELSTVDIANEFVKLVTLQRAFQANSRIVTTVNSLMQEIIQLV